MGAVYLAEDTRLGRKVAVKMIRSGAAGPDSRQRLQRKAQLISSLNHPHICAESVRAERWSQLLWWMTRHDRQEVPFD